MTQKTPLDRRNFLKTSSAALGMTALNHRAMAGVGPGEKIRVANIGVGGMGTGRMRECLNQKDVDVVAVCDVDRSHANRAAEYVIEARDKKPDVYGDFRRIIDRDDIDAVFVTTPDHWHALPFVWACETGKDVFVEKPLSHCLYEGRRMADAAEENKRITQMGNHIHASKNYRDVVRIVRSGILGEMTRTHVWKTSGMNDLGKPADCPAPEELDYDMWLGPSPKRAYNPRRSHFTFRYFWDYSGGCFADFWCHISDVAYWALELDSPKSVSAVGGRYLVDDIAETPNTLEVLYDFERCPLTFTLNPTAHPGFLHMGGIGCTFQGTKGTLVTNYGQHELYLGQKKVDQFEIEYPELPPSPGHVRQFFDGVKNRVECDSNVQYSHHLAKGFHLGLIAYRTGEKIIWDDKKERITSSRKANKLLKKRYRRPWKL